MPASLTSIVEAMTLIQASALLARGRQSTLLAVLVDRVDDPIDAWVTADGLVLRVNEDDFEVLVGTVLVDPVAVEDTQVGATATDTLLGGGLERALILELVHTMIRRLACGNRSDTVACSLEVYFCSLP